MNMRLIIPPYYVRHRLRKSPFIESGVNLPPPWIQLKDRLGRLEPRFVNADT